LSAEHITKHFDVTYKML